MKTMPTLNPGDVVLVGYYGHQEDKSVGEARWIIVIEDLQDEFEVVPMTSEVSQKYRYPKSFIVDDTSVEGKKMGLKYPSLIMPERKSNKKKIAFYNSIVKGKCSDDFLEKLIALL